MSYCGEQSAVKHEVGGFSAVSLRCKSWLCPDCQSTRKKQLIAQAIGGEPTKFLTLTSKRREHLTPEQAAKEISHAWRLVRLRIMRRLKVKKLPFIAVMEKTKLGWPHLHILCRMPWFSVKQISIWMKEIMESPFVWIEHLDKAHKAAVYCSKYATKCEQKVGTSKRYWQSQDYDLRPERPEKPKYAPGWGWEMWPLTLTRWCENQEAFGLVVVRQSSIKATATHPEATASGRERSG